MDKITHQKSLSLLNKIQMVFVSVGLPIVLMWIVYYGFITGYMPGLVFDPTKYIAWHTQGIYQSRSFGLHLLLPLCNFLLSINWHGWLPSYSNLLFRIPTESLFFYFSLVLYNLFFFILSNIVAFVILQNQRFSHVCFRDKLNIIIVISFLIAITQYVPLYYDCQSYFFCCAQFF